MNEVGWVRPLSAALRNEIIVNSEHHRQLGDDLILLMLNSICVEYIYLIPEKNFIRMENFMQLLLQHRKKLQHI